MEFLLELRSGITKIIQVTESESWNPSWKWLNILKIKGRRNTVESNWERESKNS